MYSAFTLSLKYIKYYLNASNSKGHGVHSPFVFEFIEKVLNDNTKYEDYAKIEKQRKRLLSNGENIEVEDFGAGSTVLKTKTRSIKNIATSSLKPKKYSQLLFRIINYYQHKNIAELGTSFGITTCYLAIADNTTVTTLEGSKNIANIAQQNFKELGLKNVALIVGEFEKTLQPFLAQNRIIDLAFIDGNHRKLPTLHYFEQMLLHVNENSFLVFDDIHWSKEMEDAWEIIKNHGSVTLSIDLFFIGIIFLKKDFKAKQHYSIRF